MPPGVNRAYLSAPWGLRGRNMRKTVPWHSVAERVYHNNLQCRPGAAIPEGARREGTGGKKLCEDCARLAAKSAPRRRSS